MYFSLEVLIFHQGDKGQKGEPAASSSAVFYSSSDDYSDVYQIPSLSQLINEVSTSRLSDTLPVYNYD